MSTILITGVSGGLGRALAEHALQAGHRVAGTARRPEDRDAFANLHPTNAAAYVLDLDDRAAIASVIPQVEHDIGPIDVLVANAGYGHEGTFEETTMDELRRQFEINVFGTVATIKAVLPGMRERRAGHILVITSVGGLISSPGLSAYNGSKFALEGIVGALSREVAGFGVNVTAVAPGEFRTNWSGSSMTRSPRTVSDYDDFLAPIRTARAQRNGNQPGDPGRAAEALLTILASDDPPTHLLLGRDALQYVATARDARQGELERWRPLSESTDFIQETPDR